MNRKKKKKEKIEEKKSRENNPIMPHERKQRHSFLSNKSQPRVLARTKSPSLPKRRFCEINRIDDI
jgi:hypothetical protein